MDSATDKCLFSLKANFQWQKRVPLAAIYCMAGPDEGREATRITIDALKPREALPRLIEGAHKDSFVDRDRLTQRFDAAERVMSAVAVRRLTYPWEPALLPHLRDAILADAQGL